MYVKLFGTILRSSIWAEDPATRLVWITLLTLADENGYVRSSTSGLARMANVPIEDATRAVEVLCAPDLDSGSPEHEGRRIEPVQGGWYLFNYTKYREIRTKEQLANAERQKRYREKAVTNNVTSVTSNDSNAQKKKKKQSNTTCEIETVVNHYLSLHPRRRIVDAAGRRKIKARLADKLTVEDLCAALDGQAADKWCIETNMMGLDWSLRDADNVNKYTAKGNGKRARNELPLL